MVVSSVLAQSVAAAQVGMAVVAAVELVTLQVQEPVMV